MSTKFFYILVALGLSAPFSHSYAESEDALALATQVAERPANEGRVGTMHFDLTNKAGKTRQRKALMAHSAQGEDELIAIYFTAPTMIEGTAFLSLNFDERSDETWIFLPATDRVRRLPQSDRGDYFMGTDLSYGDLQDNFKFPLENWNFAMAGSAEVTGASYPVLAGKAKSDAIAAEIGYSAFEATIDPETLFPRSVTFFDPEGEPLKAIKVLEVDLVGTAYTAMRFSVENLKTGHHTNIHFTDMRYIPDLDDGLFSPDELAFGVPDVD